MATTQTRLGEFGILLGGGPHETGETYEIASPYDGSTVAVVHRATPDYVERAIAGAVDAFETTRKLPSWRREEILAAISQGIAERRDELAETIALEAGKPLKTALGEVDRATFTFKVAAEESKRIYGEIVPLDWLPGNEGRRGEVRRVPLGVIAGISPFNFPLNLVSHKVAPALAAGNPILLRPASQTPVAALKLGEIVYAAGWPADAFAVLPCSTEVARPLVEDDRIKKLSFTGSPEVGWALKAKAGKKKVVLELGGNAAVVVDADADLTDATQRIVFGAFYQSGRSCIGVQRVLVHEAVYDAFRDQLVEATRALVMGDPKQDDTFIGPLISEAEAQRLERWIAAARESGGRVLCGGNRKGALLEATLLEDVPKHAELVCKEAFGPVAVLSRFRDFDAALAEVNDSAFGLQAGVFTRDLYKAQRAWDVLEVGGVLIGDVPSWRVDNMPYGGVKDSGLGREGVRFAIEDMTEIRLLVVRTPGR
jgi:acyl-CoA reductase-like NAD-dependent aldehyde dehydrogenase